MLLNLVVSEYHKENNLHLFFIKSEEVILDALIEMQAIAVSTGTRIKAVIKNTNFYVNADSNILAIYYAYISNISVEKKKRSKSSGNSFGPYEKLTTTEFDQSLKNDFYNKILIFVDYLNDYPMKNFDQCLEALFSYLPDFEEKNKIKFINCISKLNILGKTILCKNAVRLAQILQIRISQNQHIYNANSRKIIDQVIFYNSLKLLRYYRHSKNELIEIYKFLLNTWNHKHLLAKDLDAIP